MKKEKEYADSNTVLDLLNFNKDKNLTNLRNISDYYNSGEQLIDRMKRGIYKVDKLTNSSVKFSGDREQKDLVQYTSYIKSIWYEELASIGGEIN